MPVAGAKDPPLATIDAVVLIVYAIAHHHAGVSDRSPASFNVGGLGIILILVTLDATWW